MTSHKRAGRGSFKVVAVDGGGLQVAQIIHFELLDINENPPVFVSTPGKQIIHILEVDFMCPIIYIITALQDQEAGTFVANLTASDLDHGLNSVVRYKLIEPNLPFMIDDVTGRLVTSQK